MTFNRRHDPLLETVREIQEYCEASGLTVFAGHLTRDKETVAIWNPAHSRDWQAFLGVAVARVAGVVYLDWAPFEDQQIDEALIRPSDEAGAEAGPRVEEYNRELDRFRGYAGTTSLVEIAYSLGGVFHFLELAADWFAEFEDLVDAWDDGAYQPRRLSRARVHELANQLVNHPHYKTCQSKAQRRYLLEQLLGREFESLRSSDTGAILDRAAAIFDLEIKPLERSYLRQRARELKEQGLSLDAIAGSLEVSRAVVKTLLAG